MRTVSHDHSAVERALRAGTVRCPVCRGCLRPWGSARTRAVRLGSTGDRDRMVRPLRGRCRLCHATHVLLPHWMVARRAYAAPVIREVLADHDRGLGYRRIAGARKLPETTVRDWLRAFRRPLTRRPLSGHGPGLRPGSARFTRQGCVRSATLVGPDGDMRREWPSCNTGPPQRESTRRPDQQS